MVHATHLTDEDRAAAGRHAHDGVPLPDHRTRPGRRHRSGPGPGRRGQPAVPGLATATPSSTCSRRPGRSSWTSGCATERRGHFAADELLTATVAGHAALGWPDAGRIGRGRGPTWSPSPWTRSRTAGSTRAVLAAAVVFAAVRGRRTPRRGRRSADRPRRPAPPGRRRTRPARRRDRGGAGGDRLLVDSIGELVTNDPASARAARSGSSGTRHWSSRTVGSPGSGRATKPRRPSG